MTSPWRWALWIVLLLVLTALVLLDRREEPAVIDVAPPRSTPRPALEQSQPLRAVEEPMILPIRPRGEARDVGDAFPTRDWSPPPPPAPKAVQAAPPAPSAPPFPYTVFGKKLEDGQWQVFLRRDERILVVKSLDTIENQYRVDEIRPPMMTLTYLPLQLKQSVAIGGVQ